MSVPAHVAAGVLRRQGQVLVSQRRAGDEFAGLWEFPGGKLEPGETPVQSLRRELAEELGITVGRVMPLLCLQHRYPRRTVVLHVFDVLDYQGQVRGLEGQVVHWLDKKELSLLPFMPANGAILKAVLLPKVYGITWANKLGIAETLVRLEVAITNGLRLLQVREPDMNNRQLRYFFEQCREICRPSGVKLLLHGHPGRALRWYADGVHLTSSQLFAFSGRPLPEHVLVAASCHSLRELVQAAKLGADFAVLSPLKKTRSHPLAQPLGWKKFTTLCNQAAIPVYALGGMHWRDVTVARNSGAQGVAMMRACWHSDAVFYAVSVA